jgi:hypothetical protein
MEEKKPAHWVMDYETLVNCFIAVFQHYKDETIRKTFVIYKDRNDLPQFIDFLNECKNKNQWHISYNGLAFDGQISQHILDKQRQLLTLSTEAVINDIYAFAQKTINLKDQNSFLEYAPAKIKIRQIDLFKMNHWDNRAKMSSLKWIQYSMDWQNVEEMPHHHTAPVETDEQLKMITEYCVNDVLSTKKILEHSKEQIVLRQTLTNDYGIDLYSASEPRISKELFLHFLSQKLGWDKSYIKTLRTHHSEIYLGQCMLPYVKFQTEEFKKMHDYLRTQVIISTKNGFKYTLDYKGMKTDYGLGGIHGARAAGVYEAKQGYTIMTSDVTSFYPNLAIRNGFHPSHLPKEEFCDLYEWFFEERKKIPKSDPKNYVYKIILNSTYGLTGDENSFLYDPKMTMQITINGQLLLSMLYEMICEEIPEAVPLMQNTDGFETLLPTYCIDKYHEICDRWCKTTQLELEHDEYSKMIIRDVNNYIAVSKSGKVKCKGAFEWEDLDKKKVAVFHKNKSFLVIPKAIHAYFTKGVKPEDFLAGNQNIFDYCAGIKSKGGWYFENKEMKNGELITIRQQKIVRYYVSNKGGKLVKCHPDGRLIQVESGPWLQTTINEINETVPFDSYSINKSYYLEQIYKEITQIEKERSLSSTQLSLF